MTVEQGLTRSGLSTAIPPATSTNATVAMSRDPLLPLSTAEVVTSLSQAASPSWVAATSGAVTSASSLPGSQSTAETSRQQQQQALQASAPNPGPSSFRSVYGGQASSRADPQRLSSSSAITSLPVQLGPVAGQTGTVGTDSSQQTPAISASEGVQTSNKLGAGGVAGIAVGIFVAVMITVGLVWLYRRRKYAYGSRTVKRGSQPSQEQKYPSEGWTDFQAVTPTVEKGAVSSDIGTPAMDIASTKRTPYGMFSQYAAILPPPSMRSKRTSAITNRSAGQATVDTALDSVLCLPYPSLRLAKSQSAPDDTNAEEPMPSGVTSPAISSNFPNTTRSSLSRELQADENLASTPAYSQRSTMTEISLSAVGMGRAM